ncbi:hypothetical protein PV783_11355 [Chitinophaga sp. CC14]|uniref:hypothetical protein n=1 Tax=Chitinophaga sp. CC14 TaxID=3029199 RepID=UPI003B7BDAC6
MGQRANYVIKNGDQLTIHYHHWRANSIASDLYFGEKPFLRYISECTVREELMDPIWMEGFVILDMAEKLLGFWAWELENETSVLRYYLSALKKKWPGWQIMHLANEMYDAEPLLGIDYVSQQPATKFECTDPADIINDPLGDYPNVLFIIRQNEKLFVAETNITLESIICYGKDIVALLETRPAISMPAEGQTRALDHLFIDVDNKQLIANASIFGIWKMMAHKWPEYTLKMGRMGYLAMLEEANIPTIGLEIPKEKVQEAFAHMTTPRETYDPTDLINHLTKEPGTKIEFINPHFFDKVSPRKP